MSRLKLEFVYVIVAWGIRSAAFKTQTVLLRPLGREPNLIRQIRDREPIFFARHLCHDKGAVLPQLWHVNGLAITRPGEAHIPQDRPQIYSSLQRFINLSRG